jgi:Ni,Fe-hydrogenase I large subunit
MIKYFSKIRQRLLIENKVSKYLLYAIGEIVLIVIGILIALKINNWNEYQKAIKSENEYLTSLQNEISANIERLKLVNANNNIWTSDGSDIVQKLKIGIDTLSDSEVTRAFNFYESLIKSPVLDIIVSSNSNVLVKKKGLITDFRNLNDAYNAVLLQESYMTEFWNTKVVDFFISCGIPYQGYLENETTISMKEIEMGGYSEKQFIALLKIKSVLQDYWEVERDSALERSKEILNLLKNAN